MNNEQRKNPMLSSVVEHGIHLSDTQGCANGWAYMQAYGVPQGAIARVLAFPYARRGHSLYKHALPRQLPPLPKPN